MRLAWIVLMTGCWRTFAAPSSHESSEVPVETIALSRPSHQDGCRRSAENVRSILHNARDPDTVRHADPITDAVLRRCVDDDWPVELKDCLWRARTLDDLDPCEDVATPAQRAALDAEIDAILRN